MVEPQKEATTTAKAKDKSSLLDDEIGKDFFSSWKSMSMAEDDLLDFNCGSITKGKKSSFNFDKLDMDFSLDGDFDKISSFKVAMPDLDFSSPAKKPGKANERTGKESNNGKHGDKQDRFTFSFDFNELDSFDFDSTLKKGEKKSDRSAESAHDMQLDSPGNHEKNQGSKSNLAAGIDAFEGSETKKLPTLNGVTTTNFEHNDASNDYPSISANLGNLSESAASPEKETSNDTKVASQCNEQSDRTFSTEPNVQNITQGVSTSSVSGNDSIQEAVPELQAEICSPGTEVNMTGGGERDANVRPITGLKSNLVISFNCEGSPPLHITGLPSANNEFEKMLENQNFVPMGDINGSGSVQGDTDVEDAPIESVSQKMIHSKTLSKEDKDSTSKLLLAPGHSEPEVHKPMQNKEKGMGNIRSKLLNRSEETESQLNIASTPKKIRTFNDKRIETVPLCPIDERSKQDFCAGDAQAGNQNVISSRLHDRAGPKGLPVILESEKNAKDHNTSGMRVQPARVAALKTQPISLKTIDPKLVASSITPVRNNKNISIRRNDIPPQKARKTLEKPGLKVPSPITLKHGLSQTAVQREIKSLKTIEGNSKVGISTATKTVHAAGAEKRGLPSPSLKRKKSEASDPDPATSYPLKRITDSPSASRSPYTIRKASESPEIFDRKLVHNTSSLDIPRDTCYTEFEVPLTVENDGIVEKAEACAKELEDICNMLKKKHEEAKEILVRAIVNNNNLLMLNHPIYDEKIRMVQRFAARMMSRELQT